MKTVDARTQPADVTAPTLASCAQTVPVADGEAGAEPGADEPEARVARELTRRAEREVFLAARHVTEAR